MTTTFNERDWVIHPKTGNHGQVLEIVDDVAYIELDNGVEMDFHISELMLEEEYKSPEEERQEKVSYADAATPAIAELILAKVQNLLQGLAQHKAAKAAKAVVALGGTAAAWEDLNAFQKMNFISAATGTTYADWVTAYNENRMAVFQFAVLASLVEKAGVK